MNPNPRSLEHSVVATSRTQKSPIPTEIPNCHFTRGKVNAACQKIWNKPFSMVEPKIRETLIDEYHRLRELPSLGLVSSEADWNEIEHNFDTSRFHYRPRYDLS